MKRLLIAILFLFVAPVVAKADLKDVSRATCKVYSDEGTGTGVVFLDDKSYYYILTAAHVVFGNDGHIDNELEVEFFIDGFKSRKMLATTDLAFFFPTTTTDIAVLKLSKIYLGQYPKPSVIPLAKSDESINRNDIIVTCGCPQGRWPSIQVGHVNFYRSNGMIIEPHPTSGRSGSGVFNKSGDKILGILIWKSGVAVPAKKIRMLLTGEI